MLKHRSKSAVVHMRERGLTLIEVMVALLVASVGLLGLAGLQSSSLFANANSYRRSQAVLYANEIAERMRANPAAVDNGDYDHTSTASGTDKSACTDSGGCGTADMAKNDLSEWVSTLSQLPEGAGVVCVDSSPDDGTDSDAKCDGADVGTTTLHTIKVFWRENGSQQRYATQVRINR